MCWIKSYITSRSFDININYSLFPVLSSVPQGSVLGLPLYILYTAPLSYLISDSSISNNTTVAVAIPLIYSALDYCNSLNLPASQLNRLQLVLSAAARVVIKTQSLSHLSCFESPSLALN